MEDTITPSEASRMFGMSVSKLARYRRDGKIWGQQVGNTNTYVYKVSELRKIDWSTKKPGMKPGSKRKKTV